MLELNEGYNPLITCDAQQNGGRAAPVLLRIRDAGPRASWSSSPLRNRVTYRYWRIQEVLKHAKHFRGGTGCGRNCCYRLAVRAGTLAFVKCTKTGNLKKRIMKTLWINRITAATQEHGPKYLAFTGNLIKCQVERHKKVLADLAVYEPKTFTSLAALANRRRQEEFAAALGDRKAAFFSRMVQHR
ncbi:LOW QUALITY PROTEIN: large ribosomal subunit protein bL20m-like [Pongo pygmaeus]|uniref:LOW QUALITY PROTEIN: large ribosomal subunit protein bL20m-like n=1 Tax=Pongo pygmaeus TaxID=9600 RepID=UPI0023E2DA10|nr:LOW QUALITY PROTEIN: 39S ribosomal protein L20, mitochondrial-like [Pongo pygmaeus]XP_054398766.1 LOW QUALITY PROTEIN: 39S ribosomal protein L20, mitochondrial-like [Pongo abelii]